MRIPPPQAKRLQYLVGKKVVFLFLLQNVRKTATVYLEKPTFLPHLLQIVASISETRQSRKQSGNPSQQLFALTLTGFL